MPVDQLDLPRCPFRNPLITHDYGCEKAREMTRREGPDIGCTDNAANRQCHLVFDAVKQAVLTSLSLADDLTLLPASLLSKIQYGTALGLLRESGSVNAESVDNIHAVITQAEKSFSQPAMLPLSSLVAVVTAFQLRRRRGS